MKKHKDHNDLGLKPSDITHASSTDKSTTIHYKNGNRTTIAHNILSPKMRQQLKALTPMAQQAATEGQKQESQDQSQYGKVIMKAEGGSIGDSIASAASSAADWLGGDTRAITKGEDEHKARTQDSLRHANEAPRSGYAEGGKVQDQSHMKMIADLIKAGHHDAAHSTYQKYCSGGEAPKMYAMGSQSGPIGSEDTGEDQDAQVAPEMQDQPTDQDGGIQSPPPVQSEDHRTGFEKSVIPGIRGMASAAAAQAPQTPSPAAQDSMAANDNQTTGTHAAEAPNQAPQQQPEPTPATASEAGIGHIDQRAFESNQAPPQQQAAYNQAKAQTIQQSLAESKAITQDLDNGHITPKTYSDLMFNNPDGKEKSTLGKIGSIFGMMLSSMGAGLSHQPNMFLEMMNKQIDNDLKSQENSATNKQNILKINQHRVATEAAATNTAMDTKLKAYTLSRMQMQQTAFHNLSQQVNAMPVGSKERNNAEQGLAMMMPYIQNDQFNMVDRMAAAQAYAHVMGGQGQGGSADSGSDAAFQAKQRGLQALVDSGNSGAKSQLDYNASRHIPGIAGEASDSIPQDKRNQVQAMTVLDNKGRDVLNFVKQHSGTWNPQTRAQAIQKVEEMKNFYNDSINGGALTQGRLGWYDEQFGKHSPTDIIEQLRGNTKKLEEMVKSNGTRRDLLLSGAGGLGFPKQKSDQDEIRYFGGQAYKRGPDGKPVKVSK